MRKKEASLVKRSRGAMYCLEDIDSLDSWDSRDTDCAAITRKSSKEDEGWRWLHVSSTDKASSPTHEILVRDIAREEGSHFVGFGYVPDVGFIGRDFHITGSRKHVHRATKPGPHAYA
ncbi:hypothetical protein K0M31_014585 [Melipona bicolor]|uniref:Uncharacterized protein n=1 Tax=Melipona bicolor TaxID=60889 RepID=A0AA40KUG0_9HYME|nr:hypothetical protein K0M31_014585 [Melipona bicolor]